LSPEDQLALKMSFEPKIRAYRFYRIAALSSFCALFGFIIFAGHESEMHRSSSPWLIGCLVIDVLLVLLTAILSDCLLCPCCQKKINKGVGEFCPNCGSEKLVPGGWFSLPRCPECRRQIRIGRGNRIVSKIRVCTWCGIWLSDSRI
jgi:hypothetical protein